MTGWPALDFAVSWPSGPAVSSSRPFWCSITSRVEGKVSIRRGKQYELDQVQPGEMTLTLRNDDGLFDPMNASSPFAGHIVPYRLIRLRAQLPPTANILTADQATAWYASKGAAGAGSTLPPHVDTNAAGYPITVVNLGSTNGYKVSIPASPTGVGAVGFDGFSVVSGGAFTAQGLVSGTAGLQVQLQVIYLAADGATVLSTPTGSTVTLGSGQSLVTASVTAPANACGAVFVFQTVNSLSTASSFTVSNVQAENAATPSAWGQPGTWYSMFTGYVERWPQSWLRAGNYGQVEVTAVDIFAWLSSRALLTSLYLDILAMNPTWFYPLDDTAGSAFFADLTNQRAPAQLYKPGPASSGNYILQIEPGQSIQVSAGPTPQGFAGPVVRVAIPPSATGSAVGTQLVDLTAGGANRAGPATSAWTRILAFQMDSTQSTQEGGPILNISGPPSSNAAIQVAIGPDPGTYAPGSFTIYVIDPTTGNPVHIIQTANTALDLFGWHLLVIGYDPSYGFYASLDGGAIPLGDTPGAGSVPTSGNFVGGTDTLGGSLRGSRTNGGATGQYAIYAELPYLLSGTQLSNLYASFLNAWSSTATSTETSGGRYNRILAWLNFAAPTQIDTGNLLAYGPATDIVGGANPTAALAALQNVADSEVGQHYVAADGTVVFKARSARWNTTSVATFGENSGEIPYSDPIVDYDPTRLANDVTAQAESSASSLASSSRVVDRNSVSSYGTVSLQRTVNTISQNDITGAAQYLCYQNSQPAPRLEALPINVGANPALWALLLPLDLGATVQVNRRPSNAPPISLQGFVEQIQWDIDDQGAASYQVQLSSTFGHQFAALDDATYGLLDSTAILAY